MTNPHKNAAYRKHRGFTLIEVMVAVAIIGVALPALIMSLLGQIDSISYVRDKMEAQLVAENRMAEFRVRNAISGTIPKKEEGVQEMASREWFWKTDFKEYPQDELKGIFAVEIQVWLKGEGDIDTEKNKPAVTFYGALLKRKNKPIKRPKPEEFPIKRNVQKKS